MPTDSLLRLAVLLAALTQIVAPIWLNPFRQGQNPVRNSEPSMIEPAGYAFSIWGPIYLFAVVYAIWQILPAGRRDQATNIIAPLALCLYVGSTLWLAAAKFGPLWATMPILAVMALCAVLSLIQATGPSLERSMARYAVLVLPFAMYAGWTVCALFVNIAEVAPRYGFDRFGLSVIDYGVLSIIAATVVAALVLWLSRAELAFAATVGWALVAIAVAANGRAGSGKIILAAGLALAVVALLTFILRATAPTR